MPRTGRPKVPKGPRERRISIRGVIEPAELRFCQVFLAFGKKDMAEAYRRAFLRKNSRGEWVDVPRDLEISQKEINEAEVMLPHDVSKRAAALMRQAHIQDTLAELQRSPSEHARQTLVDNILFGSAKEKKDAVDQIIKDEDKLGLRDASEKWAEVMCEAGAEVVVPLGVVQRQIICPHCGAQSEISVDLAVEVPLSDLFPDAAADAAN